MPRFSWLVPPLLGCLVVCVYAWVVCSAREGGSRPLLLVYLPVMSVLRFRERASVAVAGFGKVGGRVVEPVVALVAFGVCVAFGVRPQTVRLCRCLPGGFRWCSRTAVRPRCPVRWFRASPR